MNQYELALVINPMLEESALLEELDRAKDYITRFGGEIEKVDNWGKRRLAYEIKKQTDGFYYFIFFSAPNSAPKELEGRLRIMENVIRYLITRKDA